jgi:hypothetical protein
MMESFVRAPGSSGARKFAKCRDETMHSTYLSERMNK